MFPGVLISSVLLAKTHLCCTFAFIEKHNVASRQIVINQYLLSEHVMLNKSYRAHTPLEIRPITRISIHTPREKTLVPIHRCVCSSVDETTVCKKILEKIFFIKLFGIYK